MITIDSDANECTIYSMYVKILFELNIFASHISIEKKRKLNTRSKHDMKICLKS